MPGFALKVTLGATTRRVNAQPKRYRELRDLVIGLFQESNSLQDKPFSLVYLDDEEEWITLDSDGDLETAYEVAAEGTKAVLKIKVQLSGDLGQGGDLDWLNSQSFVTGESSLKNDPLVAQNNPLKEEGKVEEVKLPSENRDESSGFVQPSFIEANHAMGQDSIVDDDGGYARQETKKDADTGEIVLQSSVAEKDDLSPGNGDNSEKVDEGQDVREAKEGFVEQDKSEDQHEGVEEEKKEEDPQEEVPESEKAKRPEVLQLSKENIDLGDSKQVESPRLSVQANFDDESDESFEENFSDDDVSSASEGALSSDLDNEVERCYGNDPTDLKMLVARSMNIIQRNMFKRLRNRKEKAAKLSLRYKTVIKDFTREYIGENNGEVDPDRLARTLRKISKKTSKAIKVTLKNTKMTKLQLITIQREGTIKINQKVASSHRAEASRFYKQLIDTIDKYIEEISATSDTCNQYPSCEKNQCAIICHVISETLGDAFPYLSMRPICSTICREVCSRLSPIRLNTQVIKGDPQCCDCGWDMYPSECEQAVAMLQATYPERKDAHEALKDCIYKNIVQRIDPNSSSYLKSVKVCAYIAQQLRQIYPLISLRRIMKVTKKEFGYIEGEYELVESDRVPDYYAKKKVPTVCKKICATLNATFPEKSMEIQRVCSIIRTEVKQLEDLLKASSIEKVSQEVKPILESVDKHEEDEEEKIPEVVKPKSDEDKDKMDPNNQPEIYREIMNHVQALLSEDQVKRFSAVVIEQLSAKVENEVDDELDISNADASLYIKQLDANNLSVVQRQVDDLIAARYPLRFCARHEIVSFLGGLFDEPVSSTIAVKTEAKVEENPKVEEKKEVIVEKPVVEESKKDEIPVKANSSLQCRACAESIHGDYYVTKDHVRLPYCRRCKETYKIPANLITVNEPQEEKPVKKGPAFSSQYIRNLAIDDGEEVPCSTTIVKCFVISNNGEERWPNNAALYLDQEVPTSGGIPTEVMVGPLEIGQEYELQIPVTTPSKAQRFVTYWKMGSPTGPRFGERFWIDVNVVDPNQGKVEPKAEISKSSVGFDDLRKKYGAHYDSIMQLEAMGFGDRDRNHSLLIKHKGNQDLVIDDLLRGA